MSGLTRVLFFYLVIGLMFTVMMPDARIGNDLIDSFATINVTDNSTGIALNDTIDDMIPGSTGSAVSSGLTGVLGALQLAWGVISFAITLIAFPIALANYLYAQGAPIMLAVMVCLPLTVLGIFAILDFIRSGT